MGVSFVPRKTNFLAKVKASIVDAYTIIADHQRITTTVAARINTTMN